MYLPQSPNKLLSYTNCSIFFLKQIPAAPKILQKHLQRVFPVIYKTNLCHSVKEEEETVVLFWCYFSSILGFLNLESSRILQ